MASRTIVAERTIAAAPAAVFDWFSNATNWSASPVVLSGKLAAAGADGAWGLGARRHVLVVGSWFDEEIVAFDPPVSFDYRIRRSFPPIRPELGRMEFKEVANGTQVVWTRWVSCPALVTPVFLVGWRLARWIFGRILAAGDKALTRA